MTPGEIERRISLAREALKDAKAGTALGIAAEILRVAPGNLDALEIKALVEIERGDDVAAEESLRLAIKLAPHRRWPYSDLGRLLLKLGRTQDAQWVARSALIADPQSADAHAMLASTFAGEEKLEAAAAHFERAIAIAGRHPQLLLELGRILMRQGKLDLARPLLEAALAGDPASLEPFVCLAEIEERENRFEQATRLLDRAEAIAAAGGTDVTLQRSVLLDRMGKFKEALDLLDPIEKLSGAALLQRGRLRDRVGRFSEAWKDWTAGKAKLAKLAGRHYPAAKVREQAEALARVSSSGSIGALPVASRRSDVPQPIFITGFPRSGTTLVEQILASHSAIRAGGELPFASELKDFAILLVGGESDFPGELAQMIAADRAHWPALMRDFYLARAEAFGLTTSGASYFTDKMPLNEMWLPLLRMAFPKSPIVHVRRHPLDVLTSVIAHDMTHGFNCAYRLEDAAHHLSLVDGLLAQYQEAGITVTHELRYEALVADQPRETQRLMAAIGMPVEQAQLHFHERAIVSPTPSYAQVREPLNDRSIGRWRNYARELETVGDLVSEAVRRGNYDS